MELFGGRKGKEKEQAELSTEEAHILWRLLLDRYTLIDHLNLVENFTHDKDFKLVLNKHIDDYKNESKIFEKYLNNFSILGPIPNTKNQVVEGNSEVRRDAETAEGLYLFMRMDIHLLLLSLKNAAVNDSIRSLFLKCAQKSLNRLDKYIKYLKAKNWIQYPPLYPYVQKHVEEKVAANEIYLLWEHLVFRYNNIRQTQILNSFASDPDLKALLNIGMNIITKQAKTIEDKLLNLGVTLPRRYTDITPTPESTEIIEDKYIYNIVLMGMQNAAAIHGAAIQDIIINDNIRSFFIKLTFQELELIDKFIKYGKVKGWLYVPPMYKFG